MFCRRTFPACWETFLFSRLFLGPSPSPPPRPAPSNPVDRPPAHQLHVHWAAINQRHWHSQASVCAAARCVLQRPTGAAASCITPGGHYLLCCTRRRRRRRLRGGEREREGRRSRIGVRLSHSRATSRLQQVFWKETSRHTTIIYLFLFSLRTKCLGPAGEELQQSVSKHRGKTVYRLISGSGCSGGPPIAAPINFFW